MTKTVNDLSRRVMQRLALLQPNEDPESEDHQLIEEVYRGRLLELTEVGVGYWPASEIPDAAFNSVVMLIANDVAPEFSRPWSPEIEVEAMRRIRAHAAKRPSGEPVWFPEF